MYTPAESDKSLDDDSTFLAKSLPIVEFYV
jgi:hypothetical protein